jgi:hypothetical protein
MTSRERLMTAFACGTPDRVPVAPFGLGALDPDSAIAAELIQKTDFLTDYYGIMGYFFGAAADIHTRVEGRRQIRTIETPLGPLQEVIASTDIARATIEFPCNTADDIEKLLSIPYEPIQPDVTDLNAWKQRLGDEGIALCLLMDPICVPAEAFSPIDFCLLWADAPDGLRELIAVATERALQTVEAACQAGVDGFRIAGGEYASTQLGPTAFSELVVGPDKLICDLIHDHGAIAYFHNHGPLMDYLDMLIEIGMDACDCFEAPPWGDTDLPQAKARLQGEVCIVGNLDDMEVIDKCDEACVRELARLRIEEAGPDGFVLGGTASGTYTEKAARNFIAMAEVSKEMANA